MSGFAWILVAALGAALVACTSGDREDGHRDPTGEPAPAPEAPDDTGRAAERDALVDRLAALGIRDARVLDALRAVPREAFVPDDLAAEAYVDAALPIGLRQTISQPYVVALMTEALAVGPEARVLEVGTGSGYQAAVLAELCAEVYTIEIVPELAARARETLDALGYRNVRARVGDGFAGWPEEAPFDAVIVTAAPSSIPEPLVEQLAVGGRLVIPVGDEPADQILWAVTKTAQGLRHERLAPVRFVPMTGEAERRR